MNRSQWNDSAAQLNSMLERIKMYAFGFDSAGDGKKD
jgi:hypothetical protein